MLLVDSRAGSQDLLPGLLARSLPASMCQLEYGDVSLLGNGPTGIVGVGIEYKRVSDAVTCMTGGRFAGHQLPGMLQCYQQSWLLIEGVTRCGTGNGSEGVLQVQAWPEGWKDYRQGNRYIMWRDYQHWLMSLQQMTGLRVAHVANRNEAVAWLAALYSWWQKEWEQHKSVGAIYMPQPDGEHGGVLSACVQPRASLSRLWAMQLPGIGQERSRKVELVFPRPIDLANATEEQWRIVVGKQTAIKVVEAIRGGNGAGNS